jgi:hypothetical protein
LISPPSALVVPGLTPASVFAWMAHRRRAGVLIPGLDDAAPQATVIEPP